MRKPVRCPIVLAGLLGLCLSTFSLAKEYSPADCDAIAKRESRNDSSLVGGAARGAARGAVFGAIIGDSSRDTRRGAKVGALVGGARSAATKARTYDSVYDECVRGRVPPGY